jgi:hypothetical protein
MAPGSARCLAVHTCAQLQAWKLESGDTGLLDLLPFLEAIVRTNVNDVREVVRSYDGQDIPTAFRCARGRAAPSRVHWQSGRLPAGTWPPWARRGHATRGLEALRRWQLMRVARHSLEPRPCACRERMKKVQEQQAARQQTGRGFFARSG